MHSVMSAQGAHPEPLFVGDYDLQKLSANEAGGAVNCYVGRRRRDSSLHSVRVYSLAELQSDPQLRLQVEREVVLLRRVPQHPSLLRLDDVLMSQSSLFVITEFCAGGDLFSVVEGSSDGAAQRDDTPTVPRVGWSVPGGGLPCTVVRRLFREICEAVQHLHKNGVCHRDIKLENVFLDSDNHAKLGGLGMGSVVKGTSKDGSHLLRVSCGSRHYACPEVVRGLPYDGCAADAWSLGVVLFALVTGVLPFDEEDDRVMYDKVCNADFFLAAHVTFSNILPAGHPVKDVIRGLLTPDPSKRMTVSTALSHSFWSS